MIAMRRDLDIAAVGKTTGQLEREIAAMVAERSGQPNEVLVILMSSRSPVELRLTFDGALSEATERREP
jgi:hypothetical protein